MRHREIYPTEAELQILQILWQKGPLTVREVWSNTNQKSGYTTTLKLLQIMFEKGFVRRNDSQFRHVYEAAVNEKETEEQMVQGLMQRAFGGSASRLVLRALSSKPASKEELNAIQKLLDQAQNKKLPGKKS